MQLLKFDRYKTIEIWQVRGRDNTVLINDSQLNKNTKHYRIIFTKNKAWLNQQFYLSYRVIKRSKKEWHTSLNGHQILRYAVPVEKLEQLIIEERDLRAIL